MSTFQTFFKSRWEGKPWSYKLKYFYANQGGVALSCFFIGLATIIIPIRIYLFPGSRYDVISKYKINYVVKRDDDPNIEKIKAEKEAGRQYFPAY